MANLNGRIIGRLLLITLAALLESVSFAAESIHPVTFVGYFCPSCPSAPNPEGLVRELHPAYTHVVIAFAGWDDTGTIQNQWDAPDKGGFTVNRTVVQALQANGTRKVLLSLGGGAGNVLPGPPSNPVSFASNMAAGLSQLVTQWGLDGVDLDIENFTGDPVAGMVALQQVLVALRKAHPALMFTCAPQMTDVYPGWPQVSPGFNRYAPLLANGFAAQFLTYVMPQMYNTWAAVETAAYAQQYAAQVLAGFSVTDGAAVTYNLSISSPQLLLGYPASPSAAGSGYLPPATVVGIYQALAANASTAIGGLMTWSVGWDQQAGWALADAVAQLQPEASQAARLPLAVVAAAGE